MNKCSCPDKYIISNVRLGLEVLYITLPVDVSSGLMSSILMSNIFAASKQVSHCAPMFSDFIRKILLNFKVTVFV